jgi:hypothetical protein
VQCNRVLDAPPALAAFSECAEGLAFVYRLVIALQLVMCFVCEAGTRSVAKVLELAGLGSSRAASKARNVESRALGVDIHSSPS